MTTVWGNVSVRFTHPTRDLTFLASLLNLTCFRCWLAGSPRQTPIGTPLSGTYEYSYWVSREFDFDSQAGFGKQIELLINRLAKVEETLRELRASGGKMVFSLHLPGSINNGDTIDSTLLRIMGDLGADLLVEVFPKTKKRY